MRMDKESRTDFDVIAGIIVGLIVGVVGTLIFVWLS